MHLLNNKWTLWYHSLEEKKWDIDSYKKLCVITSIEEYWGVFNNINIKTSMLYLMREDVLPIWESSENINGGTWSFMIKNTNNIEQLFTDAASGILSENLIENEVDMANINGLSITPKTDSFIIKIWSKTTNKYIKFNKNYINNTKYNMIFKIHKKNLKLKN